MKPGVCLHKPLGGLSFVSRLMGAVQPLGGFLFCLVYWVQFNVGVFIRFELFVLYLAGTKFRGLITLSRNIHTSVIVNPCLCARD